MKRTPLKRRTKLKRKSGLRKVSSKHAKELERYYKLRNAYMAEHPVCEMCGKEPSVDLHHRRGRGKYLCEVAYFMALDRKCHDYIHKHGAWARSKGYLISRFAR